MKHANIMKLIVVELCCTHTILALIGQRRRRTHCYLMCVTINEGRNTLQRYSGNFTGQFGPGWASRGLLCFCCHVRSATAKAVEVVPFRTLAVLLPLTLLFHSFPLGQLRPQCDDEDGFKIAMACAGWW
jgi:hypothetical protein